MSYPLPPLINGKAYEWADIIVNIGGVPITGITSVEYSETQTMENVYAAGRFPNARTYGKVEPTAKVSMLMSSVEAIQAVSPSGRIQDLPEFDIPVVYLDTNNVTVRHKLRNVRFMSNMRTSNAGEGALIVEIDLVLSHIEFT